jgi:hypothetical protein
MPSDDLWKDAEIISSYTRRQAIEDGVLVQLSGDHYEGDPWIPAMCAEAGFRFPIAMTTTAFVKCVAPIDGEGEQLAPCQDIKGRLWDVLWMLKCAIRRTRTPTAVLRFSLRVVPNVPENYAKNNPPRPKLVQLKSVCGPDDDGGPCITIMLPEED